MDTENNKLKDLENRMDNLETTLYEIKKYLEINKTGLRIKEPEKSKRDIAEEEVLSQFDFGRVVEVMRMLDWVWYMDDGTGNKVNRTPDEDEVKKEAKKLIQRCWKGLDESTPDEYSSKEYEAGTGGLCARAFEDSDGDVFLDLKFVLEEYRYEPY